MHEAKTHLSRLAEEAVQGEDIVIAKNGKPFVRLVPVRERCPIIFGLGKGKIRCPDDFNDPLPEDILRGFEGGLD